MKKRGIVILAIVLVLGFVVWYFIFSGDAIKGTWDYDGITMYHFNGKGKGELILPENSYEFRYELTETEVSLDFMDEKIQDMSYKYQVEKESLTLYGTVGTESFSYEMKEIK